MSDLEDPIRSAPDEVKRIIIGVLKLEEEKLYQDRPRVHADILTLIKDAVGEEDS